MRIGKIVNGIKTSYFLDDKKVVAEKTEFLNTKIEQLEGLLSSNGIAMGCGLVSVYNG